MYLIGASLSKPQYCWLSLVHTYVTCTKETGKCNTWYIVGEMVCTSHAQKFPEQTGTAHAHMQENFVTWTLRWKEKRDQDRRRNEGTKSDNAMFLILSIMT